MQRDIAARSDEKKKKKKKKKENEWVFQRRELSFILDEVHGYCSLFLGNRAEGKISGRDGWGDEFQVTEADISPKPNVSSV